MTFVVPDRMPAVELGATNSSQFMKALYEGGVHFVPDLALKNVRREGNRLVATLRNMYTERREELAADHIVVEHGTLPADELYHALKGARATMARSTSMPSWPAGRRGSTPTRPGATSCSGSATRWPAATSMRRSTIRCGSARISEATEG